MIFYKNNEIIATHQVIDIEVITWAKDNLKFDIVLFDNKK